MAPRIFLCNYFCCKH